jgi:hypothetical protein
MTNQEALDLFEEQLKRLKAMYDLFFNGARKLPPMEDRRRLEALIHELAKVHIRDNAHRFRYNTLLGRYNQYRELWGRMMREREEGPVDFRRRNAAMKAVPEPPPPPEPPARVTSGDSESYVRVGSNGDHEAMLDLEPLRDIAPLVHAPPNLGRLECVLGRAQIDARPAGDERRHAGEKESAHASKP